MGKGEVLNVLQSEAVISVSLVWAVTQDTGLLDATLPVTFHCLILCSNLGYRLNHRELIPVTPLYSPPSPSCIRPMHRTTGPDAPRIPARAQRFSDPQAPIGICLPPLSKWASVLSVHSFYFQFIALSTFLFKFPLSLMMSKYEFFCTNFVLSSAFRLCRI